MHKVLITGANGQLGRAFAASLDGNDAFAVRVCGHEALDISNELAIRHELSTFGADILINCAAYTAVDAAEEQAELADTANNQAVATIAKACHSLSVKLIHFSTDYIFDGKKKQPYIETDTPRPLNIYGRTKLAGEIAAHDICPDALIIRTSGIYAPWGHNFVRTIYARLLANEPSKVVADQIMSTTEATTLADAVKHIILSGKNASGIFNYANTGATSWYGFAVEIARIASLDEGLISPVKTSEYPTKAARPQYSVLDTTLIRQTFGIEIPEWKTALTHTISKITIG